MATDRDLIQIVDTALAEAARRSGRWLVCRPGCSQCCLGPFAITELDARRLRTALSELASRDPGRAARLRQRARAVVRRGELADDEPCPALDPVAGLCELYDARPITCRTFGPPVRCGEETIGVCELCFQGATEEEIAACEVEVDPGGLEAVLVEQLPPGETTVALALAAS